MRNLKRSMLIVIFVVGILASGAWAASKRTTDSEKIIDVAKLKAALNEATMPISGRLKDSKLLDQFKKVNSLLEEDEVPKELLLKELKGLKQEMDGFTADFQSCVDPLWEAEESIGETVNRVRTMLAQGKSGEPTKRAKALLKNYDQRLENLAKTIEGEKNEERKKRLRIVFANVLSLRDLVEKSGSINLGPASEAVYIKILTSLTNLELALTNATFSIERTKVVLEGQSEWVGNYCQILEGLIEAENLSNVLAQMNDAGEGIASLNSEVGELSGLSKKFTNMMDKFASKIADHINSQTSDMTHVVNIENVDIDKKIQEYASRNVVTANSGNSN